MKSAVIYARYSSSRQRDVSIEQQVNACRKYADENDMSILRVYDDHAMTGTNDNRPAFRQMIADSVKREFDFVIVYTLDRFSRDRYDSAVHKHTLKENGVRVLSAMEHITDDPTGALMESILEGFAEYYSKELSQKIRRGIRSNAEKGLVIGPLPYGYKKSDDGRYEINPAEAEIVREIYRRVDAGEHQTDIQADLNARGLVTRNGRPWGRSSFEIILHNERYVGTYIRGDIKLEGKIPPILDKEVFDRVQARLRTKKNPQGNPARRKREESAYLLTGKLYCGECKAPMVGVSAHGRSGVYRYYACREQLKKKCKKRPARQDAVESLIARQILDMISDPAVSRWIADSLVEYMKKEDDSSDAIILQDQLTQKRKEKENVLKAIRMGSASPALLAMLEEIEADESSLAARLSVARDRKKPDITAEHVLAFLEEFRAGNIEDKAFQETLFDVFLVRAYLYDDGHFHIVTNLSGEREADVPFDVDSVEGDAVRIASCELHSAALIRTVTFIRGLFVISGQTKKSR